MYEASNVIQINSNDHVMDDLAQNSIKASLKRGYAPLANDIIKAILFGNYSKRQQTVLWAITMLTYGVKDFEESRAHGERRNRKTSRIKAEELAEETYMTPQDASKVLNSLIKLKVLIRNGGKGEVGFNTNLGEWIPISRSEE